MTAIALFIIFFISAAAIGSWLPVFSKGEEKPSAIDRIAFGGCLQMIIAMLVCCLLSFASAGAKTCVIVFSVFIVLAAAAGIVTEKRTSDHKSSERRFKKGDAVFYAVAAAVTVLQVMAVTVFRYEGFETIKNVKTATLVFETGKLSLADPMMLLTGCISAVTGIHPQKLIYTHLPAVLITFYNICYCSVICTVSKENGRFVAFLTLTLLNVFGYQSPMMTGMTMLLSWFSLSAFLIHGLLGVVAVILIRYLQTLPDKPKETIPAETDEEDEEWDMNRHKIINARNLAIAIGALAVMLLIVVFVLNNKINRLYETTVSLQEDLNRRGSVFVFSPDGDGVEGYLIKGSDGNLSFIGGGGVENSEALIGFLEGYGTEIANWYVYGKDDSESGAVEKLISDGRIKVGKIYLINREELEGFE